jgi:hypothetical protein
MLKLLKGEMSRVELMSALGLRDEKNFRTHYQQAVLAWGVLEMTVPDKSQSRLQKMPDSSRSSEKQNKRLVMRLAFFADE